MSQTMPDCWVCGVLAGICVTEDGERVCLPCLFDRRVLPASRYAWVEPRERSGKPEQGTETGHAGHGDPVSPDGGTWPELVAARLRWDALERRLKK